MLVHVPWKYAELLFLNPRTIEKTSAFALQWSYEVKCLCSRTWSQVTDVALTASGVIDGATFSLLQLCQVTLSAELSLHAGCTLWSWKSLGSSGNHILALKRLFNVGSSICGNPSSRYLHQQRSQNKIFIKKKIMQAVIPRNIPTSWRAVVYLTPRSGSKSLLRGQPGQPNLNSVPSSL